MPRIRLDTDLRPVTEFRANAAALIARVRETKRPLVLTQHGRGAVVLVDVHEYQKMLEASDEQADNGPAVAARSPSGAPAATAAPRGARADALVDAYKGGIDRSLIRENLRRPIGERLRRLAEMTEFSESLRNAPRQNATAGAGSLDQLVERASS